MSAAWPQRLTLRRAKGFDLQTVSLELNGLPARRVSRPGRWGNPFAISELAQDFHLGPQTAHDLAVDLHRQWLTGALDLARDPGVMPPAIDEIIAELGGHNLACWCKPGDTCHADILIALANPVPPTSGSGA